MTVQQDIKKQGQLIARCEKFLSIEKLKQRRADTRKKIELGGLVIKSGMARHEKTIILGSLDYVFSRLEEDEFLIRCAERGAILMQQGRNG